MALRQPVDVPTGVPPAWCAAIAARVRGFDE
jgi:hypothetical protein